MRGIQYERNAPGKEYTREGIQQERNTPGEEYTREGIKDVVIHC